MILVSDILGWVMGRLDLTRRAGHNFSKDQFIRELQDGLVLLSEKWPVLEKTESFTSTLAQSIYVLDKTYRPINILSLTTDWPNLLTRRQPQEMRDFTSQAINQRLGFPFAAYTDQPTYWTFHPNLSSAQMGDVESPGSCIEIQEASKITAGHVVSVRYSYVPRLLKILDKTDTIDVGEEYELPLKVYTAWKLAIRYRPELVNLLRQEYLETIDHIQRSHRRRAQSSETEYTDRLLY